MRKLLLLYFFVSFSGSCAFIRMDDSIDLGNKYRYVQDYPQAILYHKSPEYKGGGINIVPPVVLSYKFNDRYIIAKSQEVDKMTGNGEGLPIHYWIVDKTTDGTPVEPMDSSSFYQQLKELEISLSLK
ncbi:hypothetical protein [Agriterribacter sp.]|uniref:hypothetical protein n=1 Tax=Agriterribacter sp. TaxID=2821509 RepID=UPI002C67D2A9|nr:hypothetical protein [Agriterribacter sp.]HRP56702.1 hypothetical protein [Agriterribacter sp.]